MQILTAFVIMGLIGAVAVVLVAAAALVRLLPLLIVVLVVVRALRWWGRRGHRRRAPSPPTPPRPITAPGSAPPPWPTMPRPDGWVMVPMWLDPHGRGQHHRVIDAEVISVDEHHG
jgi:hypothetical protein